MSLSILESVGSNLDELVEALWVRQAMTKSLKNCATISKANVSQGKLLISEQRLRIVGKRLKLVKVMMIRQTKLL